LSPVRPRAAAHRLDESSNRFWGYPGAWLNNRQDRPIDVAVHWKRPQRLLPRVIPGLHGWGMLERARAAALALLGATAAVGLAIAALAANQGWPLVPGSAIPAAPKQHVGEASVVARQARAVPSQATVRRREAAGRSSHPGAAAPPRPAAQTVTPPGGRGTSTLVVADEAPAASPGRVARRRRAEGSIHARRGQGSREPVAARQAGGLCTRRRTALATAGAGSGGDAEPPSGARPAAGGRLGSSA